MANLKRRDYGFLDNGFVDFYNMIDSFFNSDLDHKNSSVYNSSFKVDISENDKEYTVEAEMPGFTKDDIDINLDNDQLTLKVEKNQEIDNSNKEKNYIHKERRTEKMSRTMHFENIDKDKVQAELSDGLLTIILPKINKEETSKKIEIK